METRQPNSGAELDAEIAAAKQEARGFLHGAINSIQSRIISGLILALPFALTFWILYQLYLSFRNFVLDPLAIGARYLFGKDALAQLPLWWDEFVAPLLAIVFVLTVLYVLGHFARSRLHRMVDFMMSHLPVVTTIYRAITNVFQSLDRLKHVVLVDFPHPGTRALAFVTNSLRDSDTGRTIFSVWVLTGLVPPAGFTLFVPAEEVTNLDWNVNQTLQAILSGGITTPPHIFFDRRTQSVAVAPGPDRSMAEPEGIEPR
jgi:uncharacterized membrane protein